MFTQEKKNYLNKVIKNAEVKLLPQTIFSKLKEKLKEYTH